MPNYIEGDYSFSLVSEGFNKKNLDISLTKDLFFGYCFHNDRLFHSEISQSPNLSELLGNYSYNCGVFSAVLVEDNKVSIFTDPLGQYPVFYYINNNEFIISNSFFDIGEILKDEIKINEECMSDYISYQSALNQETLIKGVKRLTIGEKIILERNCYDGYNAKLVSEPVKILPFKYDDLLDLCVSRFRLRAKALLQDHSPVVHLSGGVDSRLTYAALASQGYNGPVFSFGNGESQDRLIYEELCKKFNLTKGAIQWFNKNVNSTHSFLDVIKAFNGLKTNNFSNWSEATDFRYCEVTGYFSGGLLKGYGNIGSSVDTHNFTYAIQSSGFDRVIFDISNERIIKEKKSLMKEYGNELLVNQLMYLRNRSSAHFGCHSMVNNQSFLSIDLLYDPVLMSLTQASEYSTDEISQSSVGIDLIRALAGDDLAFFPYDNRVIKMTDRWKDIKQNQLNCFTKMQFPHRDLGAMEVKRVFQSQYCDYPIENYPLNKIEDFNFLEEVTDFFNLYPAFKVGLNAENSSRKLEKTSLATLVATYFLLKNKNLN